MEARRGIGGGGSGLFVAVGIALAGWFVGHGFLAGRTVDRFVTVKGLAERDVKADVALWPLRFIATADDLDIARAGIDRSKQAILSFLGANGIGANQVELQGLEVTDVLANPYRSGPVGTRFIINQTLMVRSEEPDRIQAVSQKVGDLIAAGVVLQASAGPGTGPTFLFTGLNDLKPQMIAEATANARAAAQQFATDSGVELGGIRQASQGVFVILPRDPAPGVIEESQLHKTVRVVATIEYYLRD
jgi:hypothetical protein